MHRADDLTNDNGWFTSPSRAESIKESLRLRQDEKREFVLSAALDSPPDSSLSQVDEAHAAIQNLNGLTLGGSIIDVRMADHDMDQDQSIMEETNLSHPSDNIYCKNLPSYWSDHDIRQLFEPYGNVLTCRVLHHGDLTGLGAAALIRLASTDEAIGAVRDLNGHLLPGSYHPLIVRFADNNDTKAKKTAARSQPLPAALGYPQQRHNPYGSLSAAASAAAAVVASQQHVLAPAYGYGAPPAFINTSQYSTQPQFPQYSSYISPQTMIDPLYQPVYPQPSSSGPGLPPGPAPVAQVSLSVASLYIKNLPLDADRLFLYEKFAPYGAVLSVKILCDDYGNSKGVGFVNYANADSAQRAAAALNNLPVGDKVLQISFQTRRKV